MYIGANLFDATVKEMVQKWVEEWSAKKQSYEKKVSKVEDGEGLD